MGERTVTMGRGTRRRGRLRRSVATGVGVALLAGVAVIGAPAPAGAVTCPTLRVPPANDNYNFSQVFGQNTNLASGNTCYATAESGEPGHAGQAAAKSIWFSLQPKYKSAGRIYISTAGSNFDTRLGVYDTGHIVVSDLSEIASNDDVSTANRTSRVEIVSAFGRSFNVAVDGYIRGQAEYGTVIVSWGYLLTPFTSVADMVGDLTEIYLRRTPTTAEVAAAQNDYASGRGWTPAQLAQRLVNADPGMERNRSIARLYTAVLGRLPDTGGLEYWIGVRSSGQSLQEIARRMTASAEFRNTYGSLNNGQFVDLVYQNVLGRQPDASGRAYWVGRLNGGYARSALMIGFSESPEFKTGSRRLMDLSVMYRLGHVSITSSQITVQAAGPAPTTDIWAFMAETPGYRAYVATL